MRIVLVVLVAMLGADWAAALEVCDVACLDRQLAQRRGKVVLVDFWASWCPPCRWAMPELADLYRRYKDQGVEVLGISLDTRTDAAERFLKKNPVPYPVYRGDMGVKQVFRVVALPTLLIIGRDGTPLARHEGYVPGKILEEEIRRILDGR